MKSVVNEDSMDAVDHLSVFSLPVLFSLFLNLLTCWTVRPGVRSENFGVTFMWM